jgi:hypothetical protein
VKGILDKYEGSWGVAAGPGALPFSRFAGKTKKPKYYQNHFLIISK